MNEIRTQPTIISLSVTCQIGINKTLGIERDPQNSFWLNSPIITGVELPQVKMRWEREKKKGKKKNSLQLRRSRTDSTFSKTHEERLNERLTEKENELLIPITQARAEPMQLDILLKSPCVWKRERERETEKKRKGFDLSVVIMMKLSKS